ncbi:glycosyl transferase family 1 [Thalassotalea insulae]|uniref:Glycosyl transferase family 1 n=1 Tax=Thalassotalea insulae TaxID=2056778 RepID=A0ABQ6GU60_9GAMM|nr:glycosyltransferase [Thalassotalea insulae]GLX78197.1 glycosyl transferase family 1 [Thalassotalea insulae]
MKSSQTKLLIITNLFPLPWEPNRATFNKQQFEALATAYDLYFIIPIAFIDWFKHRKEIKQTSNKRYVPYFFTPKIGRRLYSLYMFLSIVCHSGFWLKQLRPQKILASWAFPDAVASSWLSKLFKADFYFKVHGSDIDIQCQHQARAQQVVKMSKTAKGILSVSQALATKMIALGIDKDKIQVIYNGVNHEKFTQPTAAPYSNDYLLFIGNLKYDKGVMELLNGFNKVHQTHPKLHLVFAGNGVMKNQIMALCKQYNISDKVTLLGAINHDEIPQWLNHCTALALPSYHEGVPNVLLEAMACGKPVIATKVGGIPEIINESICGKLIEKENDLAVADAINFILANHWNKCAIQKHSQQFSWQKNKTQLIELIESK